MKPSRLSRSNLAKLKAGDDVFPFPSSLWTTEGEGEGEAGLPMRPRRQRESRQLPPDGTKLASADIDGMIHLWSVPPVKGRE